METLRFIRLTGNEIGTVINDLGKLRITVFRDFPYLYNGTMDYELEHLRSYIQSPGAFLFAVYDGEQMVGATTCVPLSDENPELTLPFTDAGFSTEGILYFGESILLPEYRGMGLGHRFFDERERYAQSLGNIHTTCFCSVVRPESHPLRPKDYRSNEAFWAKRGYAPNGLTCQFDWQDIDQPQIDAKTLNFWTKQWQ
jgi:GNAT superfamily N-acetyltransferase